MMTDLQKMALQEASTLCDTAYSAAISISVKEGQKDGVPLMVDITQTDSQASQITRSINKAQRWIDAVLKENV